MSAGCEKLIYFGGEGDAIGNGDYLRSDLTPLPVAATLGVFGAKTFHAAPVGVFSLAGDGGRFHLFNRDGQALLVAETGAAGNGATSLYVGALSVRITDCQGNETELATHDGVAQLPHAELPYFVEGANLEAVKANLVPSLAAAASGGIVDLSGALPQVTLLQGKPGGIQVRLHNLYDRQIAGTMVSDLPPAWTAQPRIAFQLEPGERKIVSIPVAVPETASQQSATHTLVVKFDDAEKLPNVKKAFVVSVISPEDLGNLLKNGDFEEVDPAGKLPKHWQGTGAELASSEGRWHRRKCTRIDSSTTNLISRWHRAGAPSTPKLSER